MITIFTATYNRGKLLYDLYESLSIQSNKDFEWIIVDDGSTDNTKEILADIMNKTDFTIRVITQVNGGKHRAINKGVSIAKGDYFFIVDSDDTLTRDAVEKVIRWCDDLPKDDVCFAGVAGLRESSQGIIGGSGKYPYVDATNLERKKYNLSGDKAEIYKTEILRKFPFKEFEGERFLSEETVWNLIAAEGYKIRWYPISIYRCEYLEDGLTHGLEMNQMNNYRGYTYQVIQSIMLKSLISKIHDLGEYVRISKKMGMGILEISRNLKISPLFSVLSFLLVKIYDDFSKRKK